MTIKFKLTPRKNVTFNEEQDCWHINALPAQLELRPEHSPLPAGWVLLKGFLQRSGQDYSAQLVAKLSGSDQAYYCFPLPVSRKGTILELLYLPQNVLSLILEPMQSCGQFQLKDLSIKPVRYVERVGIMFNRVIPLFFKYPPEQRQRAGLTLYTPLLDLPKAYQIAGRFRTYAASLGYARWIEEFDTLSHKDRQLIHQQIKKWHNRPHFEIVIHTPENNVSELKQTLDSLNRQLFHNFRVTLITHNKKLKLSYHASWLKVLKSNSKVDLTEFVASRCKDNPASTWVMCLNPGMILAEHALYWFAHEVLQHNTAGFIYSDHDFLNTEGHRLDPVFKPDWSLELLRSSNYINCAAAIRADKLLNTTGLALTKQNSFDYHDVFLQVIEKLDNEAIRHIPAVLWHLPCLTDNSVQPSSRKTNPVAAHLKRLAIPASVEQKSPEHFKVSYSLPSVLPMISIIVPTRDALDHLKTCLDSIFNLTSYPNFEVLIVDNQSSEQATLDYLQNLTQQQPKVRVLPYPQPFNYSAINNFAVSQATGEVLCLLNNDTEVISPHWLEEMLGHLIQKSVGIVGAKLYFSDGRVQHAGDTVGPGGCANHLHSLIARDDPGYCSRAILAQDLSAVTAACLMTWRQLFLDLGGLEEKNLPVSFNDVDYCLRVREAGYRVVWTPYAELYHHESASRGKDDTPEKVKRARGEVSYMRERWKHLMRHDPFYNPNLSYERPDFSLSNAPMVKKPWA